MMCNGMLAGLVAITAPCAFVTAPVVDPHRRDRRVSWSCVAVFFVERTLKIDDPVGAIAVHGVNGAWGVLCARPLRRRHLRRRLERRAGHGQGPVLRRRQPARGAVIGIRTCFVCVFVSFYVFFKVLEKVIGNRVTAETEITGLDMPEMGALAYPEFSMSSSMSSAYTVELPGAKKSA